MGADMNTQININEAGAATTDNMEYGYFSDKDTCIKISEKSAIIIGNKSSRNIIATLMIILSTNSPDLSMKKGWDIKLIKKGKELIAEFDSNEKQTYLSKDEMKDIVNILDDKNNQFNTVLTNEYFELSTLLSIINTAETNYMRMEINTIIEPFITNYKVKIVLDNNEIKIKNAIVKSKVFFEVRENFITAKIEENLKQKANDILLELEKENMIKPNVKEIGSQSGSARQVFLITVLVAEMILLIIGSFFVFR